MKKQDSREASYDTTMKVYERVEKRYHKAFRKLAQEGVMDAYQEGKERYRNTLRKLSKS